MLSRGFYAPRLCSSYIKNQHFETINPNVGMKKKLYLPFYPYNEQTNSQCVYVTHQEKGYVVSFSPIDD